MARTPKSPSTPLASGWGVVLRAWERQEDITPWLDAIDWDSPIYVWGERTAEEHFGALQHPLSYALSLKDAGLAQAIVEAKAMHPWTSVKATQLLRDNHLAPLPALSNFWEWGVLQAVATNRNLKALPLLAEGIARGLSADNYPSLACNKMGKILAESPLDAPSVCRAIEILQPALNAHVPTSGSLAWNVLMETCNGGKGDLAVGVFEHFPKETSVSMTFIKNLALYDQFPQALFLLNRGQDIGGFRNEERRRSVATDETDMEAYLALSYAVRSIASARSQSNPSEAQLKKAEAAEDLVLELGRRFRFPIHRETSSTSGAIYAQALAYVPDAFPQVKASKVVSDTVLEQWWVNGPVDGDLFRDCFERFSRVHNEDVIRNFFEKGIELKIEAVGLNKQSPLVKKIEKLPLLLEELRAMEAPLGMDSLALSKHHMPASFLGGKLGGAWKQTLADYQAQALDASLSPSQVIGSKPRL